MKIGHTDLYTTPLTPNTNPLVLRYVISPPTLRSWLLRPAIFHFLFFSFLGVNPILQRTKKEMYKQSLFFFCFLSFSEVHGLFDDTVSEVNGIPVPIQFGLSQEEKSIAGERLFFFLFFFSEAVLSPGRTQSYEGHSDCLPQISSFVFKKSYQCARPPGGRGEGGLEINSDK